MCIFNLCMCVCSMCLSHLFESNVSHEYFMRIENICNRKPSRTSDHMGYTIEMLLSTKKISKSDRKQKWWSKTFAPWPPGRHATRYIIESRCFLQHFSQMLIRLTRPLEYGEKGENRNEDQLLSDGTGTWSSSHLNSIGTFMVDTSPSRELEKQCILLWGHVV